MSQLIVAQPEVQGSLAAAAAIGDAAADTDMDVGLGGSPAAAAAAAVGVTGKVAAANAFLQGSLFGDEVLAEAGPGSVALNTPSTKPQGLAGNASQQQQGAAGGSSSDFVPLLFGTPAPAAAAGLGGRSGAAAAAGVGGSLFGGFDAGGTTTPGSALQVPGLFAMSEEEFGRDVLGIGGKGTAAAAVVTTASKAAAAAGGYAAGTPVGGSAAGRRSSKRLKQTPERR
jgi:hypothetical protein